MVIVFAFQKGKRLGNVNNSESFKRRFKLY